MVLHQASARASPEGSRIPVAYPVAAASARIRAAASAQVRVEGVLPARSDRRAFRDHSYRKRSVGSHPLFEGAVPGI